MDEEKNVLFTVIFKNEDGIDMGGIYREALERCVEDLFSDIIDLFIPCANNKEGYKFNTDKYIPNPKHCSVEAMEMFKTVGYLIGISLRTQNFKPFYFPSIIWKYLVDRRVDIFDLKDIDNRFITFIKGILYLYYINYYNLYYNE